MSQFMLEMAALLPRGVEVGNTCITKNHLETGEGEARTIKAISW